MSTAFLESGELEDKLYKDDEDQKEIGLKEAEEREQWSRKTEYYLSMVGYSIGLGNLWRFPYICMNNGGGAFLIPFLICLALCGVPMYFMEVALGQFIRKSCLHVWNICPLFKGIGQAMNALSLLCVWYYATILAWTLVYMVNSFQSPLPWTQCGQSWNTPACVPSGFSHKEVNGTSVSNFTNSETVVNSSFNKYSVNTTGELMNISIQHSVSGSEKAPSSAEEFWYHYVLEISSGLDDMKGVTWHVSLALLVTNIIIFCCIAWGIRSVGKVVYVTATLPLILIAVLIIKGATLKGAADGIIFYLKPDFGKIIQMQTWVEASLQVFYSLGPSYGAVITIASYNKFHNNCLRDTVFLCFFCEGMSIVGGLAIFSVLGHMAYNADTAVGNFSAFGPGLAFLAYPEAISYLPIPQLWGVLFFLMLFTLGLDTQFTLTETVLCSVMDFFPKFSVKLRCIVCACLMSFLFFTSLPFATRGGIYLFTLIDWYFAAITVLSNLVVECIAVAWIYGAQRFINDIQLMIGRKPLYFFNIMWRFVTPAVLITLVVFTITGYKAPTYADYTYPDIAVACGWLLAVSSFMPIPVMFIVQLLKTKGGLFQRLKKGCRPSDDWAPSDAEARANYNSNNWKFSVQFWKIPNNV